MTEPSLLYYGDNLDVLRRHVSDESVDLVYLDPPFKSNQDYNVLFAEHGKKAAAQIKAFEDTWTWDEAAARALVAQYPDVHDGWDRLGMVHEKRGENRQAANCYRKVVAFLDDNPDYSEPAFKESFVALIAKLDPPATG